MSDKCITMAEVRERTSLSKTEIYRRMAIYKDGPAPSFAEVLRALTPRRPA